MLCKKTQPRYNLRIRAVRDANVGGIETIEPTLISNADRRRNFTNFNEQLLERIVDIKSEQL